jgi:hypothetical protein
VNGGENQRWLQGSGFLDFVSIVAARFLQVKLAGEIYSKSLIFTAGVSMKAGTEDVLKVQQCSVAREYNKGDGYVQSRIVYRSLRKLGVRLRPPGKR